MNGESEVEEGGGRAGEEREVCIHVGGNRGGGVRPVRPS